MHFTNENIGEKFIIRNDKTRTSYRLLAIVGKYAKLEYPGGGMFLVLKNKLERPWYKRRSEKRQQYVSETSMPEANELQPAYQ